MTLPAPRLPICVLVLLCGLAGAAPAPAASVAATRPLSAATATPVLTSRATLPVASSSLWNRFLAFMRSRSRMIQVGFVGMCIALYIILWRK